MRDFREKYRELGVPVQDDVGMWHVLPDGRTVKRAADNSVTHLSGDEWMAQVGPNRVEIGELWEGEVQALPGYDYLSWLNGIIPTRYEDLSFLRAKQRLISMPDAELEIALGEGIPKDSPLLQTEMARRARKRAGIEEAH